jgi:hypothetical protein
VIYSATIYSVHIEQNARILQGIFAFLPSDRRSLFKGERNVPTSDLTADLFFVSALRACADHAHTRLLPLARCREPLAPHARFSQRILLALQALRYIEPELSLSHADDWLYSRDWITYGFADIGWRVLKSPQESLSALRNWADEVRSPNAPLEAWLSVWEDLALAEVAEYARWSLARSAFNPDWADEATGALKDGLCHFSIGQVMYLIHIALRSIALAHQRGGTSIHQFGHTFASAIANYVRKATNERWTIRGMARSMDLPRSAITAVFVDEVTGLGDVYFDEAPDIESLSRAIAQLEAVH